MLLPGRRGRLTGQGWAGYEEVNIPTELSINSRDDGAPGEYKATESIDFLDGFESSATDVFKADIVSVGSGSSGDRLSLLRKKI